MFQKPPTKMYNFMLPHKVIFGALIVIISLLPNSIALAATPIFVRPSGDDTLCNGTVDVDYNVPAAPNYVVQTINLGIFLVDSGGTVIVEAGIYSENVNINKWVLS